MPQNQEIGHESRNGSQIKKSVLFSFHASLFFFGKRISRENIAIHLLSLFLFDNEEWIGFRDSAGIIKDWGCIFGSYIPFSSSENEYREKTPLRTHYEKAGRNIYFLPSF
jgi:hypothetical protein